MTAILLGGGEKRPGLLTLRELRLANDQGGDRFVRERERRWGA